MYTSLKHLRFALVSSVLLIGGPYAISQEQDSGSFDAGFVSDQGRDAQWHLNQSRKILKAVDGLAAGRLGSIEAYVLVVGLDADPVFGKEATETRKVLEHRFNASGRSILLSVGDDPNGAVDAYGMPQNIRIALAGIAAKMNKDEDVLVLYTTSHGGKAEGIVYNDKNRGFGFISPKFLGEQLSELRISRKLIMISACYSGGFIPALKSEDTIIMTAASASRPSFGCNPGNDWTFFGDALINNALRQSVDLETANSQAVKNIGAWEKRFGLDPSNPQLFVGSKAYAWSKPLDQAVPTQVTAPIGRPAISSIEETTRKKTDKAKQPL